MNDTDNANSGRKKGLAATVIEDQQKDLTSMGQLDQAFLGVENRYGYVFSCLGDENLIY
jgi:hypothetical protein